MPLLLLLFDFASFSPAVLIALACLQGGVWPAIALVWVTLAVGILDRVSRQRLPVEDSDRMAAIAGLLSVGLAVTHLALLGLGVWAMARAPWLGPGQTVMIALALGLYLGQVGNANAHDLIHRAARWPRRLGTSVYCALLFGHHASAHRLVHHVAVASDDDPNSARLNETFYAFWPRAWAGSFRAGWLAENRLRARRNPPPPAWSHPYVGYCAGAVTAVALAIWLGGWGGLAGFLAVALYAQTQLLLSDYVQHYGLRRKMRADGRLEPVAPQHSWNAPHWYSGAMMLNAPRHSDHHQNPARPFPALRLEDETMPMLPASLPAMATLALFPSLWRRVMNRRAKRWQARETAPAQ